MMRKTGNHKQRVMPYVLPVITIIALIALVFVVPGVFNGSAGTGYSGPNTGGSGVTGMAASPAAGDAGGMDELKVVGGSVSANIRLSAPAHQVMPTGSLVSVQITDASAKPGNINRSASLGIKDFIRISGKPFKREDGHLYAIDYSGPGYVGQNHTVPLSEFGIDRLLPTGSYALRTEVSYQGNTITSRERAFEVS
jgi:hypothetical protein